MKAIINFFPVVLFFIFYKWQGLYSAIYAMIAASIIQVLWYRIHTGNYEKSQVISLVAIIMFGGLTLFLRDPGFVMWKVSVINVLFALILLGSVFIGKITLLEKIMGKQIKLANSVWQRVSILWSIVFIIIAAVNSYFVIIASDLREKLAVLDISFKNVDLQTIDCTTNICLLAKQAESTWVNFKLFGSLGITIIGLIITAMYVKKYIKLN